MRQMPIGDADHGGAGPVLAGPRRALGVILRELLGADDAQGHDRNDNSNLASQKMKSANMRMPKVVQWAPQSDITTYELAQAVTVLFGIALGAKFPEDDIALFTPSVQRHFSITDHPVFK